jgi:hypothetical protein
MDSRPKLNDRQRRAGVDPMSIIAIIRVEPAGREKRRQ